MSRYTCVPIADIAKGQMHAGFASKTTAEYVALSLNEGRAERNHYLWSTRPERDSRWAVVLSPVVTEV